MNKNEEEKKNQKMKDNEENEKMLIKEGEEKEKSYLEEKTKLTQDNEKLKEENEKLKNLNEKIKKEYDDKVKKIKLYAEIKSKLQNTMNEIQKLENGANEN